MNEFFNVLFLNSSTHEWKLWSLVPLDVVL